VIYDPNYAYPEAARGNKDASHDDADGNY